MTKDQRFRYEMFVRVRDFGMTNRALFPEASTGRAMFDTVSSSVAEIEEQLTKRDLARAESQRVKVTTRRAVTESMKAIAHTARRVMRGGAEVNPFRMPGRKSSSAVLSKARMFIEQASLRQDEFIRFGLPSTFVSDLRQNVERLEQAVTVRLNSRASRRRAQSGIETALARGFAAILDLDAIVANTLRLDPLRLAEWRGARHVQGATAVVPGRTEAKEVPLASTDPASAAQKVS